MWDIWYFECHSSNDTIIQVFFVIILYFIWKRANFIKIFHIFIIFKVMNTSLSLAGSERHCISDLKKSSHSEDTVIITWFYLFLVSLLISELFLITFCLQYLCWARLDFDKSNFYSLKMSKTVRTLLFSPPPHCKYLKMTHFRGGLEILTEFLVMN